MMSFKDFPYRVHYTHYWATLKEQPSRADWATALRDIRLILKPCAHLIQFNPPYLMNQTAREIVFTPIEPAEHTTFNFTLEPQSFAFCRTDWAPYNLPVTGTLAVLKKHFPKWLRITSDGSWEDWADAREACQRVLKYTDEDLEPLKADLEYVWRTEPAPKRAKHLA